ncbi:MAG: AAA family ATPase [Micrococcaceae bacterium]
MKIQKLVMEAFGPFKDKQSIDFTELNEAESFLLSGPSGSGKTTILDAIFYALYGRLPGNRKNVEQVKYKSTFADEQTRPFIDLIFQHRGESYWVHRDLQYTISTRKTPFPAAASLKIWKNGGWEPLTSQIGDTATELERIIGLSANQFSQIVLLPQGKFDAFLRSKADDRQEILKKIFPVHTYEDIKEWFAEEKKQYKKQTEEVQKEWSDIQTAAEILAKQLPKENTKDIEFKETDRQQEALEEYLEDLHEATKKATTQQTQKVKLAEEVLSRAEIKSKTASDIKNRGELYKKVDAYKVEVEKSRPDYDTKKQALKQHEATVPVNIEHQRKQKVIENQEKVEAEYASAIADAEKAKVCSAKELKKEQFGKKLQVINQEVGKLSDLKSKHEAELKKADKAINAKQSEQKKSETKHKAAVKKQQNAIAKTEEKFEADKTTHKSNIEKAETKHKAAVKKQQKSVTRQQDSINKDKEKYKTDIAAQKLEKKDAKAKLEADIKLQEENITKAEKRYQDDVKKQKKTTQALEKEVAAHTKKHAKEVKKVDGLRALQREQAAASLAEDLEDGKPCPTCGSLEHPELATYDGSEKVTDKDIAEAEQALEKFVKNISKAESEVTKSKEKPVASKELFEEKKQTFQQNILNLKKEQKQNKSKYAQAAVKLEKDYEQRQIELLQGLKDLEQGLKNLDSSYAGQKEDFAQAAVKLEKDYEQRQIELQRDLKDLETSYPEQKEDFAQSLKELITDKEKMVEEFKQDTQGKDIDLLLKEKQQRIEILNKLVKLKSDKVHAVENVKNTKAEFTQKLEVSCFETLEEAQAAALDDEVKQQHETEIKAFERKETLLEQALKSEEYEKAKKEVDKGVELPSEEELEQLTLEIVEAKKRLSETASDEKLIASISHSIEEYKQAYKSTKDKNEDAINRAVVFQELAETVAGLGKSNLKKMELLTYVLAARLQRVTIEASKHLKQMSGRYEFRYTDEVEKGTGNKRGLGVEILDTYNNEKRQTVSLSGGESFMAALSLALGLNDVIRHEAGGADLDTLFIDEGFGSLDTETLQNVLGTLDDIRQEGRTLCMISHVDEMKATIPYQVEVIKGFDGSQIKVNTESLDC